MLIWRVKGCNSYCRVSSHIFKWSIQCRMSNFEICNSFQCRMLMRVQTTEWWWNFQCSCVSCLHCLIEAHIWMLYWQNWLHTERLLTAPTNTANHRRNHLDTAAQFEVRKGIMYALLRKVFVLRHKTLLCTSVCISASLQDLGSADR